MKDCVFVILWRFYIYVAIVNWNFGRKNVTEYNNCGKRIGKCRRT